MKRAFTLIELLVAISIVVVLSAGAFVYINQGIQRQNLLKISGQVVSDLKIANSLAKTKQVPMGVAGNLKYVNVAISDGNLVLKGVTATGNEVIFSSKKVGATITISSPSNNQLYFYASNGFLGKSDGSFYALNEQAQITITLAEAKTMSIIITIDPLGQISEGEVNES